MNIFASPLRWERSLLLAFLIVFSIGLIGVYEYFLQETNEYIGYMPLSFSPQYLIGLMVAILLSFSLIAVRLQKPSDFFQFFYCVLIIIPYGVLYEIMGSLGVAQFFLNLVTLLFPAMAVKLATRKSIHFKFPILMSSRQLIALITVCAILGTLYVAFNAPISSGFDILSSNLRRLEAREIFVGSSLGAYVSSITLNGLLPVLAYHSGSDRRGLLLVIALLCGAVFFYALGVKAHFLMIGIGYLLGRDVRFNRLEQIWFQMRWLILLILFAFAVEFVWFGYSYVADYLIRRLFSVPAFILAGYFDLLSDSASTWSLLSGLDSPNGVTYLIGELYFKDPDANANTNAFIYQLAANGALAFVANILLVIAVLLFIDSNYVANNNRVFMYLGFIFSVLLVEQNATTVLLSSGVGILLMASSVSSAGRNLIASTRSHSDG